MTEVIGRYKFISYHVKNRVATIELDNKAKKNCLSKLMMAELASAIALAEKSNDVRVIILTGGNDLFSAGADLRELQARQNDPAAKEDLIAPWECVVRAEKVTIAAVSGLCLGGGFEIALMCDLIIADKSAVFGCPEIKLGLMPGAGASQRLLRLIGRARAAHICLSGDSFDAASAFDMGLLSTLIEPGALAAECEKIALKIASYPAAASQHIKKTLNFGLQHGLKQAVVNERQNFYHLLQQNDAKEGISAFLEKRKPSW